MKRIILFVICSIPFLLKAQILFTESYTVILDTTKQIKGNFLPSFKYQNQRENLLEFSNQADLSALIGDNAITFANNVAVTRFGGETILSGGYIYGEYRHLYEKRLHWRPTVRYIGRRPGEWSASMPQV
ncbi:hypothetical protein [Ekhidna sp.]|uniref:hypothetical protein n=1 Tax=Ekhidna sp. TaxID=2608089 RepID=UPI00329921C5